MIGLTKSSVLGYIEFAPFQSFGNGGMQNAQLRNAEGEAPPGAFLLVKQKLFQFVTPTTGLPVAVGSTSIIGGIMMTVLPAGCFGVRLWNVKLLESSVKSYVGISKERIHRPGLCRLRCHLSPFEPYAVQTQVSRPRRPELLRTGGIAREGPGPPATSILTTKEHLARVRRDSSRSRDPATRDLMFLSW